jgi:hypothetical protein
MDPEEKATSESFLAIDRLKVILVSASFNCDTTKKRTFHLVQIIRYPLHCDWQLRSAILINRSELIIPRASLMLSIDAFPSERT